MTNAGGCRRSRWVRVQSTEEGRSDQADPTDGTSCYPFRSHSASDVSAQLIFDIRPGTAPVTEWRESLVNSSVLMHSRCILYDVLNKMLVPCTRETSLR